MQITKTKKITNSFTMKTRELKFPAFSKYLKICFANLKYKIISIAKPTKNICKIFANRRVIKFKIWNMDFSIYYPCSSRNFLPNPTSSILKYLITWLTVLYFPHKILQWMPFFEILFPKVFQNMFLIHWFSWK